MNAPEYWPEAGDLVWTDFDPTLGRGSPRFARDDEAGRRPALVISPAAFAHNTGFAFVCPVTRRVRPFPTSVVPPDGLPIAGEILVSHFAASICSPVRSARSARSRPRQPRLSAPNSRR